MPQSLSNVMVHLIFSTRGRSLWLNDPWRGDLHAYMSGIVKENGCQLIIANSVEDHIHLLIGLGRTVTIADLVKNIKTGSSKWIHVRQTGTQMFAWQRGYGIFSISPSHKEPLINYIRNQAEHHKTVSFQDEFRRLIQKYEVGYDEAYVWD